MKDNSVQARAKLAFDLGFHLDLLSDLVDAPVFQSLSDYSGEAIRAYLLGDGRRTALFETDERLSVQAAEAGPSLPARLALQEPAQPRAVSSLIPDQNILQVAFDASSPSDSPKNLADLDATTNLGELRDVARQDYEVFVVPTGGETNLASAVNATFDIEIEYSGDPAYQTYFDQAATRWEQIITGDLPDVFDPFVSFEMIDDLLIDASVEGIDGPGGTLGQAGWVERRSGSMGLPYYGIMEFDSADVAGLVSDGDFLSVALHEIGHILGIGTLWQQFGLLQGAGTANTRFVGTNAVSEYQTLTGDSSLTSIPVENMGGQGTRDSHWRETTFANELMTGFISGTTQPLSRMTVGSLQDLGYTVNYAAADAYTLPGGPPPAAGSISINDVSISEGQSGTKVATFTVTRTGGTAAFAVNFATANGSATTADADYVAASGTLSFGSNVNSQLISVIINGDTKLEGDETFFVNLSGATSGTISDGSGAGSIINDDINAPPPADFNGDGTSDILLRSSSGQVATWEVDGSQVIGAADFGAVSSSWEVAGAGDFNGDVTSDILWRNSDGRTAIWEIDGDQVIGAPDFGVVSNSWQTNGVGDFNGDGTSDILWRKDTGQVSIWLLDGDEIIGAPDLGLASNSWQVAGTGDFNDDGIGDILWRHADGQLAIWTLDEDGTVNSANLDTISPSWKNAGTGDFNGDGTDDLLWRNDSGQVAIWELNGNAIIGAPDLGTLNNTWAIEGIGDFNGDATSDILLHNANGQVATWELVDSAIVNAPVLGTVSPAWEIIG